MTSDTNKQFVKTLENYANRKVDKIFGYEFYTIGEEDAYLRGRKDGKALMAQYALQYLKQFSKSANEQRQA